MSETEQKFDEPRFCRCGDSEGRHETPGGYCKHCPCSGFEHESADRRETCDVPGCPAEYTRRVCDSHFLEPEHTLPDGVFFDKRSPESLYNHYEQGKHFGWNEALRACGYRETQ